jgi:hypothetical protein
MANATQPAPDEKISNVIDNVNPEDSKQITVGADAALQYAASERIIIDKETNQRLLRMTDLHILPWLCALYFMQYLDKGM